MPNFFQAVIKKIKAPPLPVAPVKPISLGQIKQAIDTFNKKQNTPISKIRLFPMNK